VSFLLIFPLILQVNLLLGREVVSRYTRPPLPQMPTCMLGFSFSTRTNFVAPFFELSKVKLLNTALSFFSFPSLPSCSDSYCPLHSTLTLPETLNLPSFFSLFFWLHASDLDSFCPFVLTVGSPLPHPLFTTLVASSSDRPAEGRLTPPLNFHLSPPFPSHPSWISAPHTTRESSIPPEDSRFFLWSPPPPFDVCGLLFFRFVVSESM